MGYNQCAIEIRQTVQYERWFAALRDTKARARINARIRRLQLGNPGDGKSLGGGLRELRIDSGPGYRVYYVQLGTHVIVLLAGGDKGTQDADIRTARRLAERL
jgi:probable addiction module antidote protein/putative addiction module killer protein